MKLPLLISVPHAGLRVPPEAEPFCVLSGKEIAEDGDEGAAEIYALEDEVEAFTTTDIARAIVDLNRAEDDRRKDGVVKTYTCWDVPVYREFPPEDVIETLLKLYHRPYHDKLRELARPGIKLGVDCHTMAAAGPPVGPDKGRVRPLICLSNAGVTCQEDWLKSMAECLEEAFGLPVSLNHPFKGGHIIRSHANGLPWVQLEFSRAPFMELAEKRGCVLMALEAWCAKRH